MGPIAGGKLEGEVSAWPEDLSFTDEVENVLLETNPEDPYSVTIWGVQVDNRFFIAGVDDDSRWVKHIHENPRVVLAVKDKLYPAVATIVKDQETLRGIQAAFLKKYEYAGEEDFFEDGGTLFQLKPAN